ncbi:MAG TPA: LysR substrate-binding domain-containing protein [Bryobacteraceae bacterium]|nr:LysR substrate-binding domain-containing protein [Bryobacteraceae bacterium]
MARPLPPLESLRVLAACVRHRSFSRAAKDLGLTPAAVSLRMRDLEAQLGVTLFYRHGPRLTVSDAAAKLAEQIDAAMSLIHSAIDRCRSTQPALRVTCAPTFASRWLVPRLEEYHASPGAQPIALDATAELLPPAQFDVAIRSGTGPWPGLAAVELLREQGTPMMSPALLGADRSVSLARLLELPLIVDPRWTEWFARAGLPNATPRFAATRFPTYELEALAAVRGVGVALLSPVLFGELCEQGALIAPFDTVVEGPNSYWALWPADSPAPHFVQWLRRQFE